MRAAIGTMIIMTITIERAGMEIAMMAAMPSTIAIGIAAIETMIGIMIEITIDCCDGTQAIRFYFLAVR